MHQSILSIKPENSGLASSAQRSAWRRRKGGQASTRRPTSTEDSPIIHEPRFDFDFSRVPVHADSQAPKLQRAPANAGPLSIGAPGDRYEQEAEQAADQVMRMPAPSGVRPALAQGAPPPMNIVQRACDQATTHVSDAPAIIEQARTEAIQYVNAAVPVVMHGLHERPDSWFGMIARELLDRHFHCPTQEQLDYILMTLQEIGALLPTVEIDCFGSEHGLLGEHFTRSMDFTRGMLYAGFFHDPQPARAGTFVTMVAQLLSRSQSYNRHDSRYNDFIRTGPGLMMNNSYSYGYFSTAAAGHELVPEPPGGVTCRPPEPDQPPASSPPSTSSAPPAACYSQGTPTSRQIVIPRPPKRAHVLTTSSDLDGDIHEERIDHDGRRFVCDHGRRVEQRW
jgi:hypothetical protein